MHRKVIKISSGGVHNICIVEPNNNKIVEDVYRQYIEGLCTDVVFRGFIQTFDEQRLLGNQNDNSDEEMKENNDDA